jgi:hypothetical protein
MGTAFGVRQTSSRAPPSPSIRHPGGSGLSSVVFDGADL